MPIDEPEPLPVPPSPYLQGRDVHNHCNRGDVCKARLDVAIHQGKTWAVANDPTGITALVTHLHTLTDPFVVLESTGGWETTLVAALHAAAVPLAVVNPR